jgi:hypothetical protein
MVGQRRTPICSFPKFVKTLLNGGAGILRPFGLVVSRSQLDDRREAELLNCFAFT